jgi:hypothetical protein
LVIKTALGEEEIFMTKKSPAEGRTASKAAGRKKQKLTVREEDSDDNVQDQTKRKETISVTKRRTGAGKKDSRETGRNEHRQRARTEDSDHEEEHGQLTRINVPTNNGTVVGDNVSNLRTDESVTKKTQGTANDTQWMLMLERMRTMEEMVRRGMNDGGVSMASGDTVTPPTNERMTKENLRKFVTGKVFPSWKFIFKKEELEKCLMSAIKNGCITKPPGHEDCQLAKHHSSTVRACPDGCRANAQSVARKRHLSE